MENNLENNIPENAPDKNTDKTPEAQTVPEKFPPKILLDIKDFFVKRGYEGTIARLVAAWLTVSCFEIVSNKFVFTAFEFFREISVILFGLLIVAIFAILTAINKQAVDKILLFFASLFYGSFAVMNENKNIYFAAGVCIFTGMAAVYCVGDWIKFRLRRLPTIIIVAALGLVFTLFVGLLTSFNYLRHYTPCYDFGIFSQMFTYMKETFQPMTTCERDRLLSHFAVHFSPVYYLLLPFFYIFPTPVTLLMGQAAVIASGLIPLYLICKKHKLSNNAIVLFALCYILMPSMANGCFYYLHENKFLSALVLWLVYALEKNKWIPTIICTFLLLSVKEDAPVYAAVLGLYFILSRRRVSKGAAVFGISVIYFIVVSALMAKYGLGTMSYRYDNFIYDNSGSLITVIKAVILNPIYTIRECFDEEKITFLLQMLVPLAFMPLMSKKPSRIILFIPFILFNLMSDYQYQHDINFQYTYGSAAFLFYLMILNYKDMTPGFRPKALAVTVCSSALMFMSNTWYRTHIFEDYKNDVKTGSIEVIDDALELVPKDASVAASTFLLPNLFECRTLYEFESTQHIAEVEYIVLDQRWGSDNSAPYINNSEYETITNIPGKVAIFHKVK